MQCSETWMQMDAQRCSCSIDDNFQLVYRANDWYYGYLWILWVSGSYVMLRMSAHVINPIEVWINLPPSKHLLLSGFQRDHFKTLGKGGLRYVPKYLGYLGMYMFMSSMSKIASTMNTNLIIYIYICTYIHQETQLIMATLPSQVPLIYWMWVLAVLAWWIPSPRRIRRP